MFQPKPPGRTLRFLLGLPRLVYRTHLGFLLGHRFLLLRQRGRTTHRLYTTMLEVMEYRAGSGESIVMAGWGRETNWLKNVEAGLAVDVETAGRRFVPLWRSLSDADARATLLGYLDRNRRLRPVVQAVLSHLLGWRFDGSEAALDRAAVQIRLVAFANPSLTAAASGI